MNIVIIGTGMYSTGKGTDGFGTILPALSEWKRSGGVLDEVLLCGTNGSHNSDIYAKINALKYDTGISIDPIVYPSEDQKDLTYYKQIIKKIKKPASAIIVVPDHLHFQVTKDCLDEALHCLVVKPFTPYLREARMLEKIARNKGLFGAVEFHKRWDRANLLMKDCVQGGNLGDILYCWVEYSQKKSIPTVVFKEWVEKTNILQYLGVHYIDLIRFITNARPKRVMAIGQKNWLVSKKIDTWDSIQCFIEWESTNLNRFTQTILTNWIDPETSSAMSDQKIKIVGTKGRYESDQKDRGIRITTDDHGIMQPNPDFCTKFGCGMGQVEWRGYGIESVVSFLNDVEALNNGIKTIDAISKNRPTFKEALVSTAVSEAATESLISNNEWIKIDKI
jgi:D-galacturonate reductase